MDDNKNFNLPNTNDDGASQPQRPNIPDAAKSNSSGDVDDIDEVIKIFHKSPPSSSAENSSASASHPAKSPSPASSGKPASTPESSSSAKASPVQPTKPLSTDATKISFDPVKPQPKPATHPAHTQQSQGASPAPRDAGTQSSRQHGSQTAAHANASSGSSSPAVVSLDDFNSEPSEPSKNRRKATDDGKVKVSFLGSVSFGVFKLICYVAFVALCCYVISTNVIKICNDMFAFLETDADGNPTAVKKDDMNVTVFLPENATTSDVAKILKDAGVIEYPWIFEQFAKFRISRRSYLTGEYLSGELTVNPMMSYDELIATLADYERSRSQSGTVRITIPEGLTVNETIDLLVQNGVGRKEDYLEALQSFEYEYRFCEGLTPEALSEYRFDTDYSYRLEGYLFPDTYDFYLNENPVSVLDKFLVNFDKKFEEEFYERCDDLGMTVDEIITLASMIEKEGNNPEDYYLISSVFHNRLNNSANYPYLNSDATLQYALQERSDLYNLDTTLDHPYNTYKYKGLPPGPICNPGTEAIYAALYPVDTSYYFFYTKKNGETVYSRTFEEHQRYINADKAG